MIIIPPIPITSSVLASSTVTAGGSFDSAYSDPFPTNGGNPGNSVVGNSFITWFATGTRLGPISA